MEFSISSLGPSLALSSSGAIAKSTSLVLASTPANQGLSYLRRLLPVPLMVQPQITRLRSLPHARPCGGGRRTDLVEEGGHLARLGDPGQAAVAPRRP